MAVKKTRLGCGMWVLFKKKKKKRRSSISIFLNFKVERDISFESASNNFTRIIPRDKFNFRI